MQLQTFFNNTKILHVNQSGFRQKHSCQTALTRLVDTWLKEIDCGKYVGSVFLDLRKAFDLVDHEILLHKLKLHHFSERSTNLFKSYLSNRIQKVKVNNSFSDTSAIHSGVPQGSILGPLLFLIYINDIALSSKSSKSMNIDLYADDSTLYNADYSIESIERNLQFNLNEISSWCKINNMALHPLKSKCMLMSSKAKLKDAKELHLFVENIPLENVKVHKVLGVLIDDTFSWKYQISKVCSKMNSQILLFKRILYYLSDDMKKMYYYVYIMPFFY